MKNDEQSWIWAGLESQHIEEDEYVVVEDDKAECSNKVRIK